MSKYHIFTNISEAEYLQALNDTEDQFDVLQAIIFDDWMMERLNGLAQFPKSANLFDESLPGIRCAIEPNSNYRIIYNEIEVGPVSIRIVKIVHPKRDRESVIIELMRELL